VGITIEQVYADMMRYLMDHTQRFFERTTPKGAEIWARVRDTVTVVLATPNAWDIRQQATLRKAAIMASLVTEENAGEMLQFVTEAEASVHYVLSQRSGDWLQDKTVFAVIDCGGSTVDTTVYRCVSTKPLSLNEACRSECVQVFQPSFLLHLETEQSLSRYLYKAGGVFVDREVRKMLERKLKGSTFGDPEMIQSIVEAFEKQVRPQSLVLPRRIKL
jgi:hypothetical protein